MTSPVHAATSINNGVQPDIKIEGSARPIKLITFFIPTLYGGGAERVTLNLAAGFADQGYEVDIVLPKAYGHLLDQVPKNVCIVDLGARTEGACGGRLWQFMAYLRRRRPSVVLSALDIANIVAILAGRLSFSPAPVIVSLHNNISANTKTDGSLRTRVIRYCIKNLYKRAAAVVAVSSGVAADFAKFSGLKSDAVDVIYNPIVNAHLLEAARECPAHPWFQDKDIPTLVAMGRLTEQKDFDCLIKAFAIVRRKKACRLVIFGDGEKLNELRTTVEDLGLSKDVQLPGHTDNPYAHLASADLFVLSSKWEGLPTVLIEALACGTPVVSTDCPSGPQEILAGGKYGELVPVGDAQKLADAIERSLELPENKRTPPRESFEPFVSERIFNAYMQVFERCAAKRTNAPAGK